MFMFANSRKLIVAAVSITAYIAGFNIAYPEPGKIEVTSAEYSDGQYKCEPDLSICNGKSECGFVVDDGLCELDDDAGPARNLTVEYFCGAPFAPKAVAAARGTRIEMKCPY
jgi:hypothetical protein